GIMIAAGNSRAYVAEAERLAGDFEAAERELERGYEILVGVGDDASAGLAVELAALLCAQSRHVEAAEWAATARDESERSKVMTRGTGVSADARLAANDGAVADALRFAAAAVMLAGETDALNVRAQAFMAQGTVLAVAGRRAETQRARAEAVRLFDAK